MLQNNKFLGAREVDIEGVGGSGCLGIFLSRGSSGGAFAWGGDMGAISDKGVEVRGNKYWFPSRGNKFKGKAAEGRVLVEGGRKKGPSGSGDTASSDLLGQETGNSGVVGGHMTF